MGRIGVRIMTDMAGGARMFVVGVWCGGVWWWLRGASHYQRRTQCDVSSV